LYILLFFILLTEFPPLKMIKFRKTGFLALSIVATILTGCMSTTKIGTQAADRKQFMLLSEQYVQNKSDKEMTKIFGTASKIKYESYEDRLVSVMNRLIPYTAHYLDNGRKINWSISLQSNRKINAYALDNGAIFISSALYYQDLTDDNLAVIISHEMAHAIRQHNREAMSWKKVVAPSLLAAAFVTNGATAYVSSLTHDIYGNSYSRTIEKEADVIGLDLLARAGYNPIIAVDTFNKIEPAFKKAHPFLSRLPTVFATHPHFEQRRKFVHDNLEALNKVYEAYDATAVVDTSNTIQWKFPKKIVVSNNFIPKIADAEKALPKTVPSANTAESSIAGHIDLVDSETSSHQKDLYQPKNSI
jgi:predicted Zn-dependent protease